MAKEYFERILQEQVNSFRASVRVKVWVAGREAVAEVRRVFAAHDTFVILEIFPQRKRVGWETGMLPEERWVFDQLAVPYERVTHTEITIDVPDDETGSIGFVSE